MNNLCHTLLRYMMRMGWDGGDMWGYVGGSGGVEQGEADYLGAIGRRIYVQLLFSFRAISVSICTYFSENLLCFCRYVLFSAIEFSKQ